MEVDVLLLSDVELEEGSGLVEDVVLEVPTVVVVAVVLADVADCEPDPELDGLPLVPPVPVDSSPSPSDAAPEFCVPPPAQPSVPIRLAVAASRAPTHRSLINVAESLIPAPL